MPDWACYEWMMLGIAILFVLNAFIAIWIVVRPYRNKNDS